MRRKETDETAITAVTEVNDDKPEEVTVEKSDKQTRQTLFKTISGVINFIPTVQDAYTSWVKPIYDNRAQISRRLNALSTAISIIFFMLYIPFLLMGKLYKDLSLGLDVAVYVCIGVYIATLLALLIVTMVSGKSTSTTMAKKHKKTRKIVLLVVRLASLAIAITALVISASRGTKSTIGATLDTVAIVFAVMSIIFTGLPLIFGGMAGFLRWLISPPKVKYRFSFVAIEWYQSLTSEQQLNKAIKRAARKYGERMGALLDNCFLPAIGKKYMYAVDRDALLKLLDSVPSEERNIAEWMIKEIFDYAEECGYIRINPCKEMELEGDIQLEEKQKKATEEKRKRPSIFNRKSKKKKEQEEE